MGFSDNISFRKSSVVSALLVLVLSAAPLLFGQATTALSGTITDPSGAAIPTATVTITNSQSGALRSTISNERGFYQFPQTAPGTYEIKAEATGFRSAIQTGVELLVGTPTTLDVEMEVGAVTEVVTVEADALTVNTTDATVGSAFNETKVRQLPLLTRNVVELLSLQTGVNDSGEVLGAQKDQNNITLDGVDVNDQENPQPFESVLPVPLDSVQEFRVTTGGANADLGRSSGGQVQLVTKGGTNDIHGSVYEYHRNTVTAANTFFNNAAGVEREKLIRNQFGVSVGGPIVKNRAFYFFNFEQRRDARSASQQRVVPSEDLKNGILTVPADDGNTYKLSADEFRLADPAGIGLNPAMLDLMKQFPTGNDPSSGTDGGLNFSGYRFNAPLQLDRKAYVAKMDFNIDENGSHRVFWRGTLGDGAEDVEDALSQYPGVDAQKLLDNSKGFSTSYTGVLAPTLINTLNVGYTRQGLAFSGTQGTEFGLFDIDELQNFGDNARPTGRIVPVWNISNDLSWLKGNHSFKFGGAARFISNQRTDYKNSFPSFELSQGLLGGLGADIQQGLNSVIQAKSGNPGVLLLDSQLATISGAAMNLTGLFTSIGATYQYDQTGAVLPLGEASVREFATREYEFYFADSWKVTPNLTVNYGVRYSLTTPPWETNGLQGAPTTGLDIYYAERAGAQELGVPANVLPSSLLTWEAIGPVNGGRDWFKRDKNNFAPRLAIAWSPKSPTGLLHAIFGDNGVFRASAGVYYSRYGSQLVSQVDTRGTFGVQNTVSDPTIYNFSNGYRYNGGFPALPEAPPGGFPATPPLNRAIDGDGLGVSANLKAPYTIPMTATVGREIGGGMTLEIGYVGRVSRKLLAQLDPASPLIFFRDPDSGQLLSEAFVNNRILFEEQGLTNEMVEANPGLVPTQPFFENMFPSLANFAIPGSASANFFWLNNIWGRESELDTLSEIDRNNTDTLFGGDFGTMPNCIVRTGCYTVFGKQFSALRYWDNIGFADFHGMTISLRKRYSDGLAFDFNYTWSHSIDLGSAAEGNLELETQGGSNPSEVAGNLVNSYRLPQSRASSDFDIRHQFNTHFLWELPFGRGKRFAGGVGGVLNNVIGGWQLSGIVRYQTALPTNIENGSRWATNYYGSGRAVPIDAPEQSVGDTINGVPGFFHDPAGEAAKFRFNRTGEAGPRNIVRMDDFFNTDLALGKSFQMPWEGHKLQFRWEMFNAFNNVNFTGRDIQKRYDRPAVLGQFRTVKPPRVMQFALRYEW